MDHPHEPSNVNTVNHKTSNSQHQQSYAKSIKKFNTVDYYRIPNHSIVQVVPKVSPPHLAGRNPSNYSTGTLMHTYASITSSTMLLSHHVNQHGNRDFVKIVKQKVKKKVLSY